VITEGELVLFAVNVVLVTLPVLDMPLGVAVM
jgi:hypothetical protein